VYRIFRVCLLFAAAASSSASPAVKTPARWVVSHQPARVVNGSPVVLRVVTPKPVRELNATWLGHDISFSLDLKQKAWFALAGASQETKPGSYPVRLSGVTASGEKISYEQPVWILRQRYPKVILKVPGRYTAPPPEDLKKIEEDKELKARLFKTISPEREWNGDFSAPVKAEISDVFGVQRVFNGAVKSTHQGLDFRVPTGTPVSAINEGTVLLARPMFFEGNCVVLDHGQGLLTLYLHFSEIAVKEGEHVAKGQRIGLSGGTGRATGPHLHLAVRWQGVYLNPQILFTLRLP